MNGITKHRVAQTSGSTRMAVLISILLISTSLHTSASTINNDSDCGTLKKQISMHLNDVDIAVLVNSIAEITGKNIIMDSRVDARVTVTLDAELDANQLHEVFLSILKVHQFKAVDIDDQTLMVAPEDAVILESTIQNLRVSRSKIVKK